MGGMSLRSRLWLSASLLLPLLLLGAGLWVEYGGAVEARRGEERGWAEEILGRVRERWENMVRSALAKAGGIQVNARGVPTGPFGRAMRWRLDLRRKLSTAAKIGLEREAQGKWEEALGFLDLACEGSLDSRPFLARARCLARLGRLEEAVKVLKTLMRWKGEPEPGFVLPASLRAAFLAGHLLAKAQRWKEVAALRKDFYQFRFPLPIEAAELGERFFASLDIPGDPPQRSRFQALVQALRWVERIGLPQELVLLKGDTLLGAPRKGVVPVLEPAKTRDLLQASLKPIPAAWKLEVLRSSAPLPQTSLRQGGKKLQLLRPSAPLPQAPRGLDGGHAPTPRNRVEGQERTPIFSRLEGQGGTPILARLALAPLPWELVARPRGLLGSQVLQRTGRGMILLGILSFVLGNLLVWRMLRRELELSRMRSDFIDLISHELRTPLTALSLKAEMLARGELRPERVRSYQQSLKAEVDRLAVLVDEILDFARLEKGGKGGAAMDLRRVSPRTLLARGLGEAREGLRLGGHRVRVRAGRDLPLLQVDLDLLARALRNLLENAGKYAPAGSDIELWVEPWDQGLRLCVRDEGPGVPGKERERIFEPFVRGENAAGKPGSGLGLALVRQAVEAHGGRVWVEEASPRGACFSLLLPLDPSSEEVA
ncbi:MAG TPA: hypothetical protein ENK02_10525 [Planctomycetes bacterium]|nr:hypothetical protein [Planctomycetota bacterium]